MTFKSKIGWPEQPNNLPTYQGDRPGRNKVRKAEMEAQGMKGIRRVDWKDVQGNEYTMNTRNGFPEVVQTRRQSDEIIGPVEVVRGFVAHVPSAVLAARFSPYSLAVFDPAYRVFEHIYTVLPFETPYNVPVSDTTDWFDVITFYKGRILINGKEMKDLQITSPPTDALPWLIPKVGIGEAKYGDKATNSYEKRVFAVYRDSVHSWMGGSAGTTATLNNPTARPYKALMCGARIEPATNKAWISQFAFTGSSWNSLSSGWAYTSAHVSMMLTPPYLSKLDYGISSEQPSCIPVALEDSAGEYSEYMSFPDVQIGVSGNAILGPATTMNQLVYYPATGVIETSGEGTEVGTYLSYPYAATPVSVSTTVLDQTCSVTCTNTFEKRRRLGQAHQTLREITVIGSPAPTYGSVECWVDGRTIPETLDFGTRGSEIITVGAGIVGSAVAESWTENSDTEFSITMGAHTLVGGNASRHKKYGSQVKLEKTTWATDVVAAGAAYYTMNVYAYSLFAPGDPRTLIAIDTMNATASAFVGQPYKWKYDPVYETKTNYTSSLEDRPETDDRVLNWTTKDFLLYDVTNGCFISIDATYTGTQTYGGIGVATLTVNLKIVTPAGTSTQLLFETTLNYLDLLPLQYIDWPASSFEYVPSPQQRVIFTPLYQEQGDFKGAAYTTSGEVANGATSAYLFNFVLKLDTYYAIGDPDAGSTPTINFIPCNLLEMLYAYVYSSKYGVDPYERYPVTNVSRYNDFQASLFSNQWRVNYRDGTLVDWLDTLGGPYMTETMTELYRV